MLAYNFAGGPRAYPRPADRPHLRRPHPPGAAAERRRFSREP
ncbi:MAG: hypothetical protein WKG07_30985 [Hymenobacter sp.]